MSNQEPEMLPLSGSSNIAATGWSPATGIRVRFHNGSEYDHPGATESEHQALRGAESAGKWYHANLKGRHAKVPLP